MSRTFLLCASELHAETIDGLVFARLQDLEGTCGSTWSGVYSDGERFGILWGEPVSALLGTPDEDPELQLVEDAAEEWTLIQPAAEGEGTT